MGIVHLAPVGRSPGAVTAPLAYLKHLYDEQQRTGQRLEKSVLPRRLGYPVEQVVLFLSDEMKRGYKGHKAYETVHNDYGTRTAKHTYPKETEKVADIITEFVKRELAGEHKTAIFVRRVNVNDFNDCFRVIAETVLALGRPDDLGKTLWANLTGGTNILNAALLEVAFLSGLISHLYYLFTDREDQKYLQPFGSKDYRRFLDDHWRTVPAVKTSFDERYHYLLLYLADQPGWIDTGTLLRELQNLHPQAFSTMQLELFQKQWLRKMGSEIDWELDDSGNITGRIQITEAGYDIVARIEEELFRTLVQRGDAPLVDIQSLRSKLEKDKVYP
ncbi:MAG: hypothetical protein D6743_16255 [Calditrichaeota bacterium]|nr:MAG: hypothetical protein D6743_16255 [Calditrichota bacterium]